MKKSLLFVIFLLTLSAASAEILFYDDFSDGEYTTNPTWGLNKGNIYVLNQELHSEGILDGNGRQVSIVSSGLDLLTVNDMTIEFNAYFKNPGNPHEGNGIQFQFSQSIENKGYILRMFSGTRYVGSFPIVYNKFTFGTANGGTLNDYIVSSFTPNFNEWYNLKAVRKSNSWKYYINDILIGSHNDDLSQSRFNSITIFITGSTIIDDIKITSNDESLLEKYSPVLRFTDSEKYFPTGISSMMDNADLKHEDDESSNPAPTTLPELESAEKKNYMDLPSVDITKSFDFPDPSIFEGYPYRVYGREVTEGDYTALQYYIFFPFNNWRNKHEGDWELFQVTLHEDDVESIMHSVHMLTLDGEEDAAQWIDGTHPVIRVAEGSHALYPHRDDAGELNIWIKLVNTLFRLETVSDEGPELKSYGNGETYDLVRIDDSTSWINYEGRWGEYPKYFSGLPGDASSYLGSFGPRGPKHMVYNMIGSRWDNPFLFARPTHLFAGVLHSPADLHLYDNLGNHVGVDGSTVDYEIPGLQFYTGPDSEPEAFMSQDDVDIHFEGTDTGLMTFELFVILEEGGLYLLYENIPVIEGAQGYLTETYDLIIEGELYKPEYEVYGEFPDDDGDDVIDILDNCQMFNPDQSDINKDGIGDSCQNNEIPEFTFAGIILVAAMILLFRIKN